MARELHYRKKDNKYAVWSTVSDEYVIPWDTKEKVKERWLQDLIKKAEEKIECYIEEIDKEI